MELLEDLGPEEVTLIQQGVSWLLATGYRAAMNLARFLDQQGHRDEARTMLAAIHGWFTDGFDTADRASISC